MPINGNTVRMPSGLSLIDTLDGINDAINKSRYAQPVFTRYGFEALTIPTTTASYTYVVTGSATEVSTLNFQAENVVNKVEDDYIYLSSDYVHFVIQQTALTAVSSNTKVLDIFSALSYKSTSGTIAKQYMPRKSVNTFTDFTGAELLNITETQTWFLTPSSSIIGYKPSFAVAFPSAAQKSEVSLSATGVIVSIPLKIQ